MSKAFSDEHKVAKQVPVASFADKEDDDEFAFFNGPAEPKEQKPKRKVLKASKDQENIEKKAAEPIKVEVVEPESEPDPETFDDVSTMKMMASDSEDDEESKAEVEATPTTNVPLGAIDHSNVKVVDEAAAEEAWAQVEEAMERDEKERNATGAMDGVINDDSGRSDKNINYQQLCKKLRSLDMKVFTEMKDYAEKDFRDVGWFTGLRYTLFGHPKLKAPHLRKERHDIFCMAKMQIDYEIIEHEQALQTLYKALSGNSMRCPRFGGHWVVVGFQGNDPSTDLRGVGMFGIVQALYFLKYHKDLMLKIYNVSIDDVQNFPFMVVSFNITQIVLQTLRQAQLYSYMKQKDVDSVLDVVNQLYVGLYYRMYLIWRNENCTIVNFGPTLNKLKELAHGDALAIIKDLANSEVKVQTSDDVKFGDPAE